MTSSGDVHIHTIWLCVLQCLMENNGKWQLCDFGEKKIDSPKYISFSMTNSLWRAVYTKGLQGLLARFFIIKYDTTDAV